MNILMLHSYHIEYDWTRDQHAAFVGTLKQRAPQREISFFAEYLDTKRNLYTPDYAAFFAEYLKKKFLGYHLDAIYVTDDNALSLLLRYRQELFPGVPVVFSGVCNLWPGKPGKTALLDGVYERKDVAGNVRIAKAIDPGLKKLYFVGDGGPSHNFIARQVKAEMAKHFPGLAYELVADRSLYKLRGKLAEKVEGTVILTTLGGLLSPDGSTVPIPAAVATLAESGKFKILTMGSNYLTEGVIGGSVVDGFVQGQAAAHVLLRQVLKESPAVDGKGFAATRHVFFYPALQSWKISLKDLPGDSVIIDGPARTIGQHTRLLLGGLVFVLLQVLLLVLVLPRLRSLKLIRQALYWSERRYHAVVRVINDAVIGINDKGCIVIFNPAAEKMFGYAEEEILGKPIDGLLPERFRDRHRSRLARFFSGDPVSDLLGQNVELPALHHNGEEFYVELSLSLMHQGNRVKVIAALRDVTERRRAGDELRRSEERYRALVQTQVEAVCRWLPDTTLTYVNEAYCRLYKKRPEELLGQKIVERMSACERTAMEEHIRLLIAQPGTLYHETSIPRGDDRCLWYRWSNTAIVGELGEVVEIQAVGLDITERKKVEEELRESESRFRDTADLLPQSVFETDIVGRLTFANRVTLEMTGCSDEDLARGISVFDLMAGSERERLVRDFQKVLAGETVNASECLIEARNGFRFKVMISASPVVRKNRIIGVRGVAVDISERIVAEQALRQSEKKFKRLFREYQALLDGIPDPIALIAPDRTVVRTNRGMANALGLAVQDIPGQKCCALWNSDCCAEEQCPVLSCFRTGAPQKKELRTRDGRSWEVRVFPVQDKTGTTVQVIRYASDITRQIRLREESLRTGQLASLGELAAGVAHEINNPINGIINYAQLLADSLDIAREDHEILKGIIDEGERIANIVRNLLAFARTRKEHKDRMNLWDALACSLALTESQLRKDGIRLQLDVPADLPEIIAHAQEIQQVILNLLSNARYALNKKYPAVAPDKILSIKASPCENQDVPSVRIDFHDRGIGIPEGVRHKVLDPFFTSKPAGEGTGLGLSISHGIVKDHQGEILIDSREGHFTTVTLIFPTAPEENHEH
ncbi:MAG: PAS domain S-box protein [Syntrophotalea acetylenica]|nr:PAS domain S-box protein [Syntrophotalea acetylenica]